MAQEVCEERVAGLLGEVVLVGSQGTQHLGAVAHDRSRISVATVVGHNDSNVRGRGSGSGASASASGHSDRAGLGRGQRGLVVEGHGGHGRRQLVRSRSRNPGRSVLLCCG